MSTFSMTRGARYGVLIAAAWMAVSTLSGCASSAEKKKERPAELTKLTNRIDIQRVWHTHLSGEAPKLRLGLGIAVDGPRAFAASYKGEVEAFDVATGHSVWQSKLKAPLAGGPGVGAGLVVVGSSKGEVIALNESDGTQRWRVRVNAEILSAPAVAADVIVIRGVDGKLYGLSGKDGSQLWSADQQVPRLSLRGTSSPILAGDLVVCGFDNGRVMAVTRNNGTTAWDTAVGQSRGSGELQRLIDVDGDLVADGDDLFAVAYQGRVAHLARDSGQLGWTHDLSSYRGLTVDANAVYVSADNGDLVRLDRQTGTEQWRQKALARRELTAPVIYNGRVVVADIYGVVHWLDAATGDFLARGVAAKKKRVSATPVVAQGLLLVFTDSGELAAFRAPPAPGAVASPSAP